VNDGKIIHAYPKFFIGHKEDMEVGYTTSKGRPPESVIKDMRTVYRKSFSQSFSSALFLSLIKNCTDIP